MFSWHELFNTPLGEGGLVFTARNGKPLEDREGAFSLIAAKDLMTGPKVRNLQAIDVRKL